MSIDVKVAALRDILGDRLCAAVVGDDARVLAALSVAVTFVNAHEGANSTLGNTRRWFAAECEELDGQSPIGILANAALDDLERVTSVLLVLVRAA